MQNFTGIDYKQDSLITKQLDELIINKLKALLKGNYSQDQLEFFKLVTSKSYKIEWEQLKKEITEEYDQVHVQILEFIKTDLQNKYKELSKSDKKEEKEIKEIKEEPKLQKRSKIEPIKKEDKKKGILDRIKPRQKVQTKKIKKVTEGETETDKDANQDDQDKEKKKKDLSKIRCRNWPSCNKDDCGYAHPKEQKKKFKGKKKYQLKIPCKFGIKCQRPKCSYTHPHLLNILYKSQNKHFKTKTGAKGNFFQNLPKFPSNPPKNDQSANNAQNILNLPLLQFQCSTLKCELIRAVVGNIGVGKSTLCERLSNRLTSGQYMKEHLENPYLQQFYDHMSQNKSGPNPFSLDLEKHFMTQRYEMEKKFVYQNKFLIQDRTMFEQHEIFCKALLDDGLISKKDYDIVYKMYSAMIDMIELPHVIIFLKSDVEVIINRIKNRGRQMEVDNIDENYLKRLQEKYASFYSYLQKEHKDIKLIGIDTNNLNSNEVYDYVIKELKTLKFI